MFMFCLMRYHIDRLKWVTIVLGVWFTDFKRITKAREFFMNLFDQPFFGFWVVNHQKR